MTILQTISARLERFRSPESRSGGSLNNPSVPLSAAGFLSWLMGGEPTASGEQITVNTALQQITVYACVRFLAAGVASLPVHVYELTDTGRKVSIDHDLAYLLRWEPNDEMTAYTFWECMVGSMALTGNGYAEIIRDQGGRIAELYPRHPQLTEPRRDRFGMLVYETTDGVAEGRTRTIAAKDMLHVPLFSFNGLKGLSPVQLARQSIGLARAAEKYGAKFFGNGGRPSGVLSSSTSLNPAQIDQMKNTWNQAQGGDAAQGTAVLPGEWKYEQIGLAPEESQFLETRNLQRAEIAALFGVPPHKVGDTSRLSNNNHEQMELSVVTDTLRPYITRIEAELMRKLIPRVGRNAGRHEIEFDVSERLRGDFQTRMTGYGVGKQWGFLSTNDVRVDMGKNPIGPEGDVYWAPVNMQNSALLLSTEPTLDQPVGSDPGGDGNKGGKTAAPPSEGERNLLGKYTTAYITVFRDAFQRLAKRDKRDLEAVTALIGPVLASIADAAGAESGLPEEQRQAIVADVLAAMQKRAAKWAADMAEADVDAAAQGEFVKLVRSLHVNLAREAAALKALHEVQA